MLSDQVNPMDPTAMRASFHVDSSRKVEAQELIWTVQLARRDSRALPGVLIAVFVAACLVGLLFGNLLPALAAVILLLGSIREYLFPVSYRISRHGVESASLGNRLELSWSEVRRCILEVQAITLTSLPTPSRLDVFRGVTLRFAQEGCVGEKKQVLDLLEAYVPELLPEIGKQTELETYVPERLPEIGTQAEKESR